jgi:hypothetical protein
VGKCKKDSWILLKKKIQKCVKNAKPSQINLNQYYLFLVNIFHGESGVFKKTRKIFKKMDKNILVAVCYILFMFGLIAYININSCQSEQIITQLNQKLMEANLKIGKAETKFGETQQFISKLEKELAAEIKKNKEIIDAYGELELAFKAEKKKKGKTEVIYADKVIKVPPEVTKGFLYQANESDSIILVEKLKGEFSDHRLDAKFSFTPEENQMNIPSELDYKLHLSFSGQLVKTHTDSGAINYYLNLYETGANGEKLGKLELKSFTVTTIDERSNNFYWWSPHLDISGFMALSKSLTMETGLSIGISLMGYGLTENDLLWRFADISIDIGSTLGVGLTPVTYNLGQVIPLISNLWIGPHIGINIDQNWYGGLSIGAVL